ncbi:MAG: hypothetical protein IJL29_03550 [Prevotella sp.]|nr:hypothetical protein [Prevotella sp.]
MKKMTIQRVLFMLVVASNTLFAQAQAYEYNCEKRSDGSWYCQMKNLVQYSDDIGVSVFIDCKKDHTAEIVLQAIDLNEPNLIIGKGKTGTVKLYLSNGEVLTSSEARGPFPYLFYIGAQSFTSNKVTVDKSNDGKYAMKQLRRYNIIKISVQGIEFSTPKFRSAATIDAMCKTLISKTGDQGQYGSSLSGVSTSSTRPSTTTRPNTATRPNAPTAKPSTTVRNNNTARATASLINVPALPKQMTEMQMIMHPFGVLTDNLKDYTQEQVMRDLRKLFGEKITLIKDGHITIFKEWCDGYNMSYKGVVPYKSSCTFFKDDGGLKSYSYDMYYSREKYTKEQSIQIAKNFVKKLQENNIPMVEDEKYYYQAEGKYRGRKIRIYEDYMDCNYWTIIILVWVKD